MNNYRKMFYYLKNKCQNYKHKIKHYNKLLAVTNNKMIILYNNNYNSVNNSHSKSNSLIKN